MSFRENITDKPGRAIAVLVGIVLIGIAIVCSQMRGANATADHPRAFFTIDDGKTWFPDDLTKVPPFDKDGKQAVLAHVYRCADGKQFVGYVERFKADAKLALEEANKPDPNLKGRRDVTPIRNAYTSGREVKRPGEAKWTGTVNVREAAQVMAVKCPNGGGDAVAVEP